MISRAQGGPEPSPPPPLIDPCMQQSSIGQNKQTFIERKSVVIFLFILGQNIMMWLFSYLY